MEAEIWKDVVDYEGLYQVSNLGRVKSLNYRRTGKAKVLNPREDKYGYLILGLRKDGNECKKYVHRLVSQAFIPNPDNLPQVNHKDECKLNNCVENLEWCTPSYNIRYGTRCEREISTKNSKKTSNSEKVVIASKNGVERWFKSQREAARQLGLYESNIRHCLNGRYRQTGGWSFRRAVQSDRPAEPLF